MPSTCPGSPVQCLTPTRVSCSPSPSASRSIHAGTPDEMIVYPRSGPSRYSGVRTVVRQSELPSPGSQCKQVLMTASPMKCLSLRLASVRQQADQDTAPKSPAVCRRVLVTNASPRRCLSPQPGFLIPNPSIASPSGSPRTVTSSVPASPPARASYSPPQPHSSFGSGFGSACAWVQLAASSASVGTQCGPAEGKHLQASSSDSLSLQTQDEMLHWHSVMENYVKAMATSAVQWVLRTLLCAWSARAKQATRQREELADAFAIASVVSRLVVFAWRRLVDAATASANTASVIHSRQLEPPCQAVAPVQFRGAAKPRSELNFAKRTQDLLCLSAPFHAWHRAVLCAALMHAADALAPMPQDLWPDVRDSY